MTEQLRRQGLVDENGNVDANRLRSLGSALQGMDPDSVRTALGCLGYDQITNGRYVTKSDGRRYNDNNSGSEIWRRADPDGRTIHYVRIDDAGHEPPPGESAQTRIGSNPHYHVDSCDTQTDASLSDRPGPGGQESQLAKARRTGDPPTNANGTPLDRPGGRPLNQAENYEQRYEPGATSYNSSGQPSTNFRETHHTFPGSQFTG